MSEGRLIAELKSHTLSRLLLLGENESVFFSILARVSFTNAIQMSQLCIRYFKIWTNFLIIIFLGMLTGMHKKKGLVPAAQGY